MIDRISVEQCTLCGSCYNACPVDAISFKTLVENGHRTYYENETVRKATLHAVGDLYGKIGTGVLHAFADKLTGFDLVNGAFGAERGSNLYLTLAARYNLSLIHI